MTDPTAFGYRRLPLPLPFALRSVNAYVVEGEGFALVDSGIHTRQGETALREGLAAHVRTALDDVFVTHLHPDHIGMAGWLERRGARVVMHRPEAEAARRMWFQGRGRIEEAREWFRVHGMPPAVVEGMAEAWSGAQDRVDPIARIHEIDDGASVRLAGRSFRVVWTPGHTDYHAVLYDEAERVLVAGDHVLPKITPNIGLYPGGRVDPLSDFLAALANVRELDVRLVLPAHGEPFTDLRGRIDEIAHHHELRLLAVKEALGMGTHDAYWVARKLFPVLRSAHEERFAHAETLAHLRHLERKGEAREVEGDPVRWQLAGD